MNVQRSTLNAQRSRDEQDGPLIVMPCAKPGKVWLGYRTGEGGEFDLAEVAARLDSADRLETYFRKNF